ncbi:glial cell line-derived neurotrophic factor [Megalobrama amblycephala]|uniref:glial cell line-derived neurotrophic factor n=1 Tax=Megalobrama amblycephala TaxID=75352 RepID=UPI002014824B|nr:glial cell line-derived neurotrophic factor [Megalobrama amblycephala]XP_048044655.1 glial cell line-derived neurotrophic factor [Megalobrama amblycephala]
MKIWGVMLACALMLSCVSSVPLLLQDPNRAGHSPYSQPHAQCSQRLDLLRKANQNLPDARTIKHPQPRSHSDSLPTPDSAFIHRFKRSQKRRGFLRSKMHRKRPSHDEREKGKGRACALRQVQLKVSDLGLGYRSQEELIFSYCSGVCINSLTNYDKILTSLAGGDKNILRSSPPTACCRPVEYDDDLSFLDDNLIYHIMERHSARKCGCV